jgi:hypothetical protein
VRAWDWDEEGQASPHGLAFAVARLFANLDSVFPLAVLSLHLCLCLALISHAHAERPLRPSLLFHMLMYSTPASPLDRSDVCAICSSC